MIHKYQKKKNIEKRKIKTKQEMEMIGLKAHVAVVCLPCHHTTASQTKRYAGNGICSSRGGSVYRLPYFSTGGIDIFSRRRKAIRYKNRPLRYRCLRYVSAGCQDPYIFFFLILVVKDTCLDRMMMRG